MYERVLIPTDGSERGERAAAHGVALAAASDAEVHALNVVDASALDVGDFSDAAAIRDALAEQGERATQTVADLAAEYGLETVTAVRDGTPARTILRYVGEEEVDLVAMATHGRTGFRRAILGSVTEQVVRKATVPVLTVHPGEGAPDTDYESILVATDGGAESAAATDHAVDIATRFDATIEALSVVDTTLSREGALLEALRSTCGAAVREVETAGARRDVAVTTEIREGDPAKTIVEYAGERDVDLVAMGTHGRTGLDRFVTRSVAERVVRWADVPVLAVHGGDTGEA